MTSRQRDRTALRAALLAVVLCASAASAGDEISTWMKTLRAGGMEPAEDAIAALARAGEPAVELLAELVTTGSPLERRRACAALGAMSVAVTSAVGPLVTASADRETEVRLAAVDGLARRVAARGDAREALAKRLTDLDATVRVRAATMLASADQRYADAAEPVLLAALQDVTLALRLAALTGLSRLGEHASHLAADAATSVIGDPLAPIRGAAVVALAALRPRDAATVTALCPRLGDPDPWVAMGTARALAPIEAPVASCAVGFLGAGRDAATARRVAWLLHARVTREGAAIAALAAHADDGDPTVRGLARSAAWLERSRARTAEARARSDG